MLIGEYSHTVDAKGRIIMPAKWRNELGEKFVITKSFDGCLGAYPAAEWEKFAARLMKLPPADKDARRLSRFFLSRAVECEVDPQSRVVLPQNLREFAKIQKEIVSVGRGNFVEIWSRAAWDVYSDESEYLDEEMEQAMMKFDIWQND